MNACTQTQVSLVQQNKTLKASTLDLEAQLTLDFEKLLITSSCYIFWESLVGQMVKNLPAVQETWVQSLGQEDPMEKGMAVVFALKKTCYYYDKG